MSARLHLVHDSACYLDPVAACRQAVGDNAVVDLHRLTLNARQVVQWDDHCRQIRRSGTHP